MNNERVIECKQVSKSYVDGQHRVDVLSHINLEIKACEVVAIIGPSGSGKSTLLHLLGGLQSVTQGEISICGMPLNDMGEKEKSLFRNQNLGFIYQFHHLLREFTAIENVMMPMMIAGTPIQDATLRAESVFNEVGLGHRIGQLVTKLSGGERQRVAIARAMVNHPQCILADEPTGNLDTENAKRIYDTLLELKEKHRTVLVLVTHDLSLAELVDKVYFIDQGKLVTALDRKQRHEDT